MPIEIFVPSIEEDGGTEGDSNDDYWQEAGKSEPLPGKVIKVAVNVDSFKDQGWGNKKTRLSLALYDPRGALIARENLFGTYRTDEYTAKYDDSPSRELGTEKVVRAASKGCVYKLEYTIGDGGGHRISVEGWACKIFEDPAEAMLRKYAVAMGKVAAGAIRFVFEDCLSGGCQLIYLCKKWKVITLGSKIFTLMSICSGVGLSLAGPLYEFINARQLKRKVMDDHSGQFDSLTMELDKDAEAGGLADPQSKEPLLQQPDPTKAQPANAKTGDNKEADEKTAKEKPKDLGITIVPEIRIANIVRGQGGVAKNAGVLLFAGSLWFWFTMIAVPFLIPIECGKAVPGSGLLIFFGISMTLSLLEIWVTIQSRTGYLMFKHMKGKYIMGYMLSHVGRFDTYSDVIFAKMIGTCEPITWFSVHRHVFYLPWGLELASIVLVIFVIGVLLFQALPGVLMLAFRAHNYLPIAFKLNEYNLLLTVMEEEADPHESNDELEEQLTRSAVLRAANEMLGPDAASQLAAAGEVGKAAAGGAIIAIS